VVPSVKSPNPFRRAGRLIRYIYLATRPAAARRRTELNRPRSGTASRGADCLRCLVRQTAVGPPGSSIKLAQLSGGRLAGRGRTNLLEVAQFSAPLNESYGFRRGCRRVAIRWIAEAAPTARSDASGPGHLRLQSVIGRTMKRKHFPRHPSASSAKCIASIRMRPKSIPFNHVRQQPDGCTAVTRSQDARNVANARLRTKR
jgi:hypothetical protein